MSAVTAVTAQNSLGVLGVLDLPPEFVGRQIDAVLEDLGADAIKTGMLATRHRRQPWPGACARIAGRPSSWILS